MRAIDADRLLKMMSHWKPYMDMDKVRKAVQNMPTLTPPNEPMTIEQLREMDGEPVWIVDSEGRNWYGPGWAIVDRENNLVRTVKNWNPVFFEKYGERWLAYCRSLEGKEDAQ